MIISRFIIWELHTHIACKCGWSIPNGDFVWAPIVTIDYRSLSQKTESISVQIIKRCRYLNPFATAFIRKIIQEKWQNISNKNCGDVVVSTKRLQFWNGKPTVKILLIPGWYFIKSLESVVESLHIPQQYPVTFVTWFSTFFNRLCLLSNMYINQISFFMLKFKSYILNNLF